MNGKYQGCKYRCINKLTGSNYFGAIMQIIWQPYSPKFIRPWIPDAYRLNTGFKQKNFFLKYILGIKLDINILLVGHPVKLKFWLK